MNENVDLTKILENCPKGTKFYSSIYGDLLYSCMHLKLAFQKITFIKPNSISSIDYYRDGRYCQSQGECTIFPSRDCRDWSKFTAPWYKRDKFDPKTLQPFDKVLVSVGGEWQCDLFSHMLSGDAFNKRCIGVGDMNVVIPYNDDTKHLIGTKEEVPDYYKYWINNN